MYIKYSKSPVTKFIDLSRPRFKAHHKGKRLITVEHFINQLNPRPQPLNLNIIENSQEINKFRTLKIYAQY